MTFREFVLDEHHPLWELFCQFHTGQVEREQRATAKALLFGIHYGTWNTSKAWAEVARRQAALGRPGLKPFQGGLH